MCGILGWVDLSISASLSLICLNQMEHRGPDGEGVWSDHEQKVWLGHRRLAIIDLSENGAQPMMSPSGRYIITFNGEIYNYKKLRRHFESSGRIFSTDSDTEVILQAMDEWGVRGALNEINGMFAFGVWDTRHHHLTIARDRVGIKPLYYSSGVSGFAFSSEIAPLEGILESPVTIDETGVREYFRYLCVQSPNTVYNEIKSLEPASILTYKSGIVHKEKYWDHGRTVRDGLRRGENESFEDSASELHRILREAISLELNSDVPCGTFLSGGIDSSLVTSIARDLSGAPLNTFTIAFPGSQNNEAEYSCAIADHLKTRHHEVKFGPDDFLDCIEILNKLKGEPFADGSLAPTFFVSQYASQYVKVVLSGDGGDELFGGYPRYFWCKRIEFLQKTLGRRYTRLIGELIDILPLEQLSPILNIATLGRFRGSHGIKSRIGRFGAFLRSNRDTFDKLMIEAADLSVISSVLDNQVELRRRSQEYDNLGWADQMMATDQVSYLPNDILMKADRASMANSLEVRVPLLNQLVVEASWKIPQNFKFRSHGDSGKRILRRILQEYIPTNLVDRPKIGFGMPMSNWLRDELRDWADDILSKESIESTKILDHKKVMEVWRQHLSGKDMLSTLWPVMVYGLWCRSDSHTL